MGPEPSCTSDKPQKQATAKAAGQLSASIPLPELLINVYIYHLMVKVCLAVVCMEAGFSQIQYYLMLTDNYHIRYKNFKDSTTWTL